MLTREMRFARADGGSDGRTLVGLAVPFNDMTRISNFFEGTFDEQFARGAFKRSLGMRTPKLQFNHGTSFMFDELPIGTFEEIRETDRGLEVEARIFEAPLFEPLREAIASEAIDGMSIRFRPIRTEVTEAEARDDGGEVELRTIREAELIELGPVVFPAYEQTTVDMRALGTLDLSNEIDRHRLATALLGGAAPAGEAPANIHGPGTDHEMRSPAVMSDQDPLHSERSASRSDPRVLAQRARMHELI